MLFLIHEIYLLQINEEFDSNLREQSLIWVRDRTEIELWGLSTISPLSAHNLPTIDPLKVDFLDSDRVFKFFHDMALPTDA